MKNERYVLSITEAIMYHMGKEVIEAQVEKRYKDANRVVYTSLLEMVYGKWGREFTNLECKYISDKANELYKTLLELNLHEALNCDKDMFNIVVPLSNHIGRLEADLYIENNFGGK